MPKPTDHYTIGQWVSVEAISSMDYGDLNDKKNRARHLVYNTIYPTPGVIVGLKHKQEGEYDPGWRTGGGYFDSDGDDYVPPSLMITKVWRLWQVRFSLRGHIYLVRPEHLRVHPDPTGLVLPYQGSGPNWMPHYAEVPHYTDLEEPTHA